MKKGLIYVLFSTALFSTMEVVLKLVTNTYNPIQLTFLRFLIGGIILLPLAVKNLKLRECKLKVNDLAFFSLTGFICVVVSMVLYQMAIVYSQASVVAVLFSCNPVFVILFAFLLLHEKIYKHTIVSLIISILGIIVIMNPANIAGNGLGIMLILLSAVTFSVYSVISRKRSGIYGGLALTCFSFLFGSLEMFLLIMLTRLAPISAFFNEIGLNAFASVPILGGLSMQSLPSLIYIGVFVTGLGYTFYFMAMEKTSAATASLVFFIKPALAPLIALLVIHEPITLNMAIGILLILTGSAISFIYGIKISKNESKKDAEKELPEMVRPE